MARKSRKQNNRIDLVDTKSEFIQTAAYVRLSLEDIKHKGDSIETQKRIVANYIDEHPDFELYDIYIDSGVSGTTFERPSFQRLLRDAEAGRIQCIIVKDLSRLGRNVIDTGYYAERVFPSLGVRLISITDQYDTATSKDSITLPLINLVNEAYALDIARKTKSQARQAMNDGVYVGGVPPYGYMKSPDNRRKLCIDKSSAEIVMQIFRWAADGDTAHKIARKLNEMNVPSPGVYKQQQRPSPSNDFPGFGLWYASTIKRILQNEVYLGRMVQGKTKVIDFKRVPAPPDEWVAVHGAHEAIVTLELFETAQRTQSKSKYLYPPAYATKTYTPNIFKGKLYCGHCGRRLERKKNQDKYSYRCISNQIAPGSCDGSGVGISEDTVRRALTEQLTHYRNVLADKDIQPRDTDILPELRWIEMELSHFNDITRSLYENLVHGVLNEQEYRELKKGYQVKVDELRQRTALLKKALDAADAADKDRQESLRMLDQLTDTTMLTKEYVDRFVDKIIVYKDSHVHINMQ